MLKRFSNRCWPRLYKLYNLRLLVESVVFDEYLLFVLKEVGVNGDFLGIDVGLGVHGTIIYILFIMIKNSNKVCFYLNDFIYSIHQK